MAANEVGQHEGGEDGAQFMTNAGAAATKLCQEVLDGERDPKEVHPRRFARGHLEDGGLWTGSNDVT